MKFITEMILRDLYKKEPFTTYVVKQNVRLTPGARQFLLDRKIKIIDDRFDNKKAVVKKEDMEQKKINVRKNNWKELKIKRKWKTIESLFLLTGEELLAKDALLAQEIVHLYKQFSSLKNNNTNNKKIVEQAPYEPCTNITEENFSNQFDECFAISEFHIQLERGREILLIHRLRCALHEIEPLILEMNETSGENNHYNEQLLDKVNQIINRLSQIICSLMGGELCRIKR